MIPLLKEQVCLVSIQTSADIGLNIKKDKILEISIALCDGSMKHFVQGPHIVIHSSTSELSHIQPELKDRHYKSGLLQQVDQSKISLEAAEDFILQFFKDRDILPETVPLAGIGAYHIRQFLRILMPRFNSWLHFTFYTIELSTQGPFKLYVCYGETRYSKRGQSKDQTVELIRSLFNVSECLHTTSKLYSRLRQVAD